MNIGRRALIAAIGAGSLMALAGCAQQVGDIDRTQPNKIEKGIFNDGADWYMRSTVVQVPGTAISSFVGLQGEMTRVRWEINEDYLVAYRTHEDVIGIDTNDYEAATDGPWKGSPAAAFGIRGHFDVQRAYSSATGEQSNVIMENYSDRPWYERDYMRVDWSRNGAPIDRNFDPAVEIRSMSGLSIAPQDSGLNPDDITWRIEYNEKGEANYIDVVNTYVLEPSWIDCVLTFGFPMYGGDCGPETIKVRTSFLKIDPAQDGQHEPRVYDDHELDKFGFFRTERCVYDRTYGCRDSSTVKLANLWRIWDNARNSDGTFKPYSERTPKPIVYYYTPNFPEDIKEASQIISDQWNEAYSSVARYYHPDFDGRMYYVCENPGPSPADLANPSKRAELEANPGFVGYLDGHCKAPGTVKELGDLRYSFFSWVDNDQQVGPLGYGPSSADPLTGEIVNGNANIYGAAIDRYAQYVLDILRLINNDVSEEEFANGANIRDYFDNRSKEGIFYGYNRTREMEVQSLENVKERILHRDGKVFDLMDQMRGKTLDQRLEMIRPEANRQQAVWPKLRGTELERMMINEDIKVGFGRGLIGPNDQVDLENPEIADLLSPAKIGTMQRIMGDYNRRFNKFASRNMMMGEFFDGSYLGLAIEMKELMDRTPGDKFAKMEAARVELRKRIYKGVMEHEVGHTLGLRHNFEGSFDAINFKPEYWQLRFIDYDMDGQLDPINPAVEQNPRSFANGVAADEGLSGAARDARIAEITQHIEDARREQLAAKMREYQLASIMDYGAKLNGDFHGIGFYDYAAIRYGYGELIDVFNQTPTKLTVDYDNSSFDSVQPTNEPITNWADIDIVTGAVASDEVTQLTDSPNDYALDNDMDFYHYGVLPVMFGGMNGDMSAMYDRSYMTVDEARAANKLEVPYRFCSDEYRGGTPSCDVWDEGASFGEILNNQIVSYEDYYIFNNFRRDRAAWGLYLWPIFQRFLGRTFGPMANIYQHWVLRLFYFDNAWYTSEWGGQLGWAGIERGLGTMMNTLVSPNPGTYAFDNDEGAYVNVSNEIGYRFPPGENTEGYTDFLDVPLGVGKYDRSRYDFDSGYYYFLRYEILTSFFERWAAMVALTNAQTNFIGVDAASDITAFAIPVTLLYSEELYRWFGAIMNRDMKEIGPLVEMGADEKMGVAPQNPLASTFLRSSYRNKTKINPYSNGRDFNMELFSMAYSLGMFQDLYDRTFNTLANVMVVGRGESFQVPEGWETIDWTDPTTGITYMATRSDFSQVRGSYAAGWKMISRAIDLEQKWRAASCGPDNDGTLDGCSLINSEYYEMEGHRELLDLLVMTNRVFENYNDTSWIID